MIYRGYLSHRSGYAMASMMDCLALERAGVDFSCASLVPGRGVQGFFGAADEVVARRIDPTCWNEPGPQIIRCIPTDALAPLPSARSDQGFPASHRSDQKLICATVFECEQWPVGWVTASNLYDALILPNEWLADTARRAGVTSPIHVVPHALDWDAPSEMPAPHPMGESWWEEPTGCETIRVLFEGTYMLRKNIPAAVEAFWRAFERAEAVMLVHTYFFQPEHRALLMRALWEKRMLLRREGKTDFPPVIIDSASLDWARLWKMYHWAKQAARGCAYISTAYAEGVGYPLLMAAGLGIPVVCTDCPGHRDAVPFAHFIPSTPTTPGRLWPFDPVDRTFRIAHIYEDDPWFRPDPEQAGHILHAAAKCTVADSDRASLFNRHDPEMVGRQLASVAGSVMQ